MHYVLRRGRVARGTGPPLLPFPGALSHWSRQSVFHLTVPMSPSPTRFEGGSRASKSYLNYKLSRFHRHGIDYKTEVSYHKTSLDPEGGGGVVAENGLLGSIFLIHLLGENGQNKKVVVSTFWWRPPRLGNPGSVTELCFYFFRLATALSPRD